MSIPKQIETLLDTYEAGGLPPDEIVIMAQWLIDTGLNEELTQRIYKNSYFPNLQKYPKARVLFKQYKKIFPI